MADGWLEQRTRIPFAGIVAIVLIVAVVAIFLRWGLSGLLPESTVQVQPLTGAVTSERGSASFVGERDVALAYRGALYGVVVTDEGTLTLAVDAGEGTLLLSADGREEEVLLTGLDDGRLHASFEYEGQRSDVTITPGERKLAWSREGKLPITVTLTELTRMEGYFLFDGEQYLIRFDPGDSAATFTGNGRQAVIALARDDDRYNGIWRDRSGKSHPVEIRVADSVAVIGELW